MLRYSSDKARAALWERSRLWPLWGGGARKGRVFWLSERNGERLKSRHRYCIIERKRVWKGRRFGGRSASGERQSSGSALPIEASLSASQRTRRGRMSSRAFGSEARLPSLNIYQRADGRKSADTFLPIRKVFWHWSGSGNGRRLSGVLSVWRGVFATWIV